MTRHMKLVERALDRADNHSHYDSLETTQLVRRLADAISSLVVERDGFARGCTQAMRERDAAEAEALAWKTDAAETHLRLQALRELLGRAGEELGKVRTTAVLLFNNAEGCAINHYGEDFSIHGPPGWLRDCSADIDQASAILTEIEEKLRASQSCRAAREPDPTTTQPETSPPSGKHEPVCRVDLEKDGEHVDDIAISGELIRTFRLEQMDRGYFWGAVYLRDGRDLRLSFGVNGKKLDVIAEWEGTQPETSCDLEGEG